MPKHQPKYLLHSQFNASTPVTTLPGAEEVLGEVGEAVAAREEVRAREGGGVDGEAAAPQAQLVLTASWLTMKEAALLAGTLARGLPPGGAQPPAVRQLRLCGQLSSEILDFHRFFSRAATALTNCIAASLDAGSGLILRHQTIQSTAKHHPTTCTLIAGQCQTCASMQYMHAMLADIREPPWRALQPPWRALQHSWRARGDPS